MLVFVEIFAWIVIISEIIGKRSKLDVYTDIMFDRMASFIENVCEFISIYLFGGIFRFIFNYIAIGLIIYFYFLYNPGFLVPIDIYLDSTDTTEQTKIRALGMIFIMIVL